MKGRVIRGAGPELGSWLQCAYYRQGAAVYNGIYFPVLSPHMFDSTRTRVHSWQLFSRVGGPTSCDLCVFGVRRSA